MIESGWRDQLKAHCKGVRRIRSAAACADHAEIVKAKGVEQITVEELVAEITPKGRGEPACVACVYVYVCTRVISACIGMRTLGFGSARLHCWPWLNLIATGH